MCAVSCFYSLYSFLGQVCFALLSRGLVFWHSFFRGYGVMALSVFRQYAAGLHDQILPRVAGRYHSCRGEVILEIGGLFSVFFLMSPFSTAIGYSEQ